MENLNAYELRARSGAALITHPETIVDKEGDGIGAKYNLCNNPSVIPDITKETEIIHRYGGYSTVCLCHHGGRADPLITPDGKIYGPSEVVSPLLVDNIVTPMDDAMIQRTVNSFAEAARMAKFAGYDMVTLHGAHGFIFSQFLSPRYNKRTDKYGGSIENRARFAIEVVDAIRAKCGRDFPIGFRLSGDDFMEDGAHIDEMKEFAKIMDGRVNILRVSASSFYNKDVHSKADAHTQQTCANKRCQNLRKLPQDIVWRAILLKIDTEDITADKKERPRGGCSFLISINF